MTLLVILLLVALIGGYLAVTTYQEKKGREPKPAPSPKPLSAERVPSPQPERRQVPGKPGSMPPHQEAYSAVVTPVVPRERPKKRPSLPGAGSVAIVIDDMGASLQELNSLTSLHVPLTFAVIPQLLHATEVAEIAHGRGYEIMVHLPMEPKGYPRQRLEKDGLLVTLTDQEIDRQVRRYLELVPHAAGANNHMGSRFTEEPAKMLPVLQLLKERQLYFLDSRTTPRSVGYSLAREVGVKSASRNVFLDNIQEVGAIRAQLREAVAIAHKRGSAIAICHPHPATIEALSQLLPGLKAEGITLVKLSQVVE